MKYKTYQLFTDLLAGVYWGVFIWAYFNDRIWILIAAFFAYLFAHVVIGHYAGIYRSPEYAESMRKTNRVMYYFGLPVIAVLLALILLGDFLDLPVWLTEERLFYAIYAVAFVSLFLVPYIYGIIAGRKMRKRRLREDEQELGCDESEEAFEDSFERIVPPKSGNKGDEADSKA